MRFSSAMALASAAPRRSLSTRIGASVTLSSTLICGNRLKLWNTMPTSRRSASRSTPGPLTPVVVQPDLAAFDRLEAVDAAQEGGLAASRGADQADDLMLLDRQIEAAQDLDGAVALGDAAHLEQPHQPPPARVRRWSRAMRRSTSRACGIVMSTNRTATVVTEDRLK